MYSSVHKYSYTKLTERSFSNSHVLEGHKFSLWFQFMWGGSNLYIKLPKIWCFFLKCRFSSFPLSYLSNFCSIFTKLSEIVSYRHMQAKFNNQPYCIWNFGVMALYFSKNVVFHGFRSLTWVIFHQSSPNFLKLCLMTIRRLSSIFSQIA